MSVSARRFPYEKTVILNVLYDALDAIGFSIDKSNSMRGTLLVSSATTANMRIALSPSLTEEKTLVEIFPMSDDFENSELIVALFDEMDAIIKKAGMGTV